jgi:hypothetical protein
MLKDKLVVDLNEDGSRALAEIMKATGLKRSQVIHKVLADWEVRVSVARATGNQGREALVAMGSVKSEPERFPAGSRMIKEGVAVKLPERDGSCYDPDAKPDPEVEERAEPERCAACGDAITNLAALFESDGRNYHEGCWYELVGARQGEQNPLGGPWLDTLRASIETSDPEAEQQAKPQNADFDSEAPTCEYGCQYGQHEPDCPNHFVNRPPLAYLADDGQAKCIQCGRAGTEEEMPEGACTECEQAAKDARKERKAARKDRKEKLAESIRGFMAIGESAGQVAAEVKADSQPLARKTVTPLPKPGRGSK